MKKNLSSLIFNFCKFCLMSSIFIISTNISMVLFGEPPFPYE